MCEPALAAEVSRIDVLLDDRCDDLIVDLVGARLLTLAAAVVDAEDDQLVVVLEAAAGARKLTIAAATKAKPSFFKGSLLRKAVGEKRARHYVVGSTELQARSRPPGRFPP
ncbi:MAG: hypothetical protein ACE5KS_10510, partial [Woeseiaceae bacterium]